MEYLFMKSQSNCTAESAELFVNCLEAMVETCLPSEEGDLEQYPSMLSVSSAVNLSSSLSSLTLGSPTEKSKSYSMHITSSNFSCCIFVATNRGWVFLAGSIHTQF